MAQCNNCCCDYLHDVSLQATGRKVPQKCQKYIKCRNTGTCPAKNETTGSTKMDDPIQLQYLTHPEGANNENFKVSKCVCTINMQGDFAPEQINLFKHYKRKAKYSDVEPELMHYLHRDDVDDLYDQEILEKTYQDDTVCCIQDNIENISTESSHKKVIKSKDQSVLCSCLGKIIYTDNKTQTDKLPKTINKSTGILKNKHHTQIFKNNLPSGNREPKIKFASTVKYNGDDVYVGDTYENKQKKKYRKTLWPGKLKRRDKCTCACELQLNEFTETENKRSDDKFENSVTKGTEKLSENKAGPKKNKKQECDCPAKENNEHIIYDENSAEAAYKKQTDVVCNCKKKPTECTDVTCGGIKKNNVVSTKSQIGVEKIRSKITCLCHSYTKKLLPRKVKDPNHVDVSEKGICEVALMSEKDDFSCKCIKKQKITTSDNTTCKETQMKSVCVQTIPASCNPCRSSCFMCKFKNKFKFCNNNVTTNDHINTMPQNAGDQTKEPVMELRVDSDNMRILNPDEIKDQVIDLSKKHKVKPTCICPSHNKHRKEFLAKNLCEGGICKKNIVIDEKPNFNCKCGGVCTDLTCDLKKKYRPKLSTCECLPVKTDPMFEVQLDANNMCVINSKEIIKKITDLETEAKKRAEAVSCDGICGIARAKNRNLCKCNYVEKKRKPDEVTECSKETCEINDVINNPKEVSTDLLFYLILKLYNKIYNNTSNKMIRKPLDLKDLRKMKSVSFMSGSLSSLIKRRRNNFSMANFHKRNGLTWPPPRRRRRPIQYVNNRGSVTDLTEKIQENTDKIKTKTDDSYLYSKGCDCARVKEKDKQKLNREKKRKKKKSNKKQEKLRVEERQNKEKRKKGKLERKKKNEMLKQERKEMEELSKHDEAGETNCLADFFIGLAKLGFAILNGLLSLLYKIITDPKGSCRYLRHRLRDPKGTIDRLRKWSGEAWTRQKFRMNRTIKGSRTISILKDEILESEVLQAFSLKGKTNEASSKRRQKRIRKRINEAKSGCRHVLLVTLRKTPCLWVYHICPTLYPQFLSARLFCINFSQMLLFCVAIVFWTPCIACCELFRLIMCAMLCYR